MEIRPAATLALIRDTDEGIQVLLLQRTWDAAFLPGFYVFPGGAVDASDHACQQWLDGHDDRSASAALGLPDGGAPFMIAAIRECFEEAGVLLALKPDGSLLQEHTEATCKARADMNNGTLTLADLCQQQRLKLPLDRLAYLSHWVTPPGPPSRFDTRFFVAAAPPQQVSHDGVETIDHVWLSPADALEDHRMGRRLLVAPTLRTLRILSDFDTTAAVMAFAHGQPAEVIPHTPWPAQKNRQASMIEPGEPAYHEVRKLDPEQKGHASATIVPGTATLLGPQLQRLTAGNPGMMTGPGTNTYILGGADDVTVIDPGPDDADHIARILALTGHRIRQVLVTHTHRDHSPGARALHAATGAAVMGMAAPDEPTQDLEFQASKALRDGDTVTTGAGTLRVIHTPGHASNHLCYLLESQKILFSGDHIMQGSTVVINPPDGDMTAYLASLHRLLQHDIDYIAPGHGFLMAHAHAIVDFLTTHRLSRERKVITALSDHGPATLRALTKHAYDDVPVAIHGVASRSLLAHLIKLEADGKALNQSDQWTFVQPPST
ncbi:MBL fold metallo-hydrolase [Marinobacter caseinilyticus]|uniref:MBL fold metallo-hydrolase n=1 Tax=Marinobacter caseinilyticus TaxID=2692195 RepID=UPI00140DD74E|nr:MBL fold metallo-hydrolase [Marinobacter caseinilyticus]